MSRFLLYDRRGGPTGRELADRLDIPCGQEMPDERQDWLIRWGTSQRINYVPNEKTWNLRRAIARNTDKFGALDIMDDNGVPVPMYNTDFTGLSFPVIGRSGNHMGGRDVQLFLQPCDADAYGECDYYVEYIPKRLEYRVHVINDEVVKISQKVLTERDEYDPVVWNYDNGFTFRNPREEHPGLYMAIPAVNAMDLDFGAVDLIIGEEDNQPYILEINTAPGLSENSLDVYVRKFRNLLELD